MEKKTIIIPPSSCDSCRGCSNSCYEKGAYTPLETARNSFLEKFDFNRETEFILLKESLGRVLAEDIFSNLNYPKENIAMHDGVAVNYEVFENYSQIIKGLEEGKDYIFSSMGSKIPDCFDTLIHAEKVKIKENGEIEFIEKPILNQEIKWKGFDIKIGEKLVEKYTKLQPIHLSIMKMGGIKEVKVIKKPRVAIIPTGNELISEESDFNSNKVIESNGIFVEATLQEHNAYPVLYSIVPDDKNLLKEKILSIVDKSEIIVIIGGVGKGRENYNDYTVSVVEELGEIISHGILISPGRPTLLGTIKGKPIVGIPGPPHAAIIVTEQFLPQLIEKYYKVNMKERVKVNAVLMQDFKSRRNSHWVNRVDVKWNGSQYEVYSVKRLGDNVDNFVNAKGIAIFSPEKEVYKKGEDIEIELLYSEDFIRKNM